MPGKQHESRSIVANARLEPSATEPQPKPKALTSPQRRRVYSTEIGVFFDQELFTLRSQRLSLENLLADPCFSPGFVGARTSTFALEGLQLFCIVGNSFGYLSKS